MQRHGYSVIHIGAATRGHVLDGGMKRGLLVQPELLDRQDHVDVGVEHYQAECVVWRYELAPGEQRRISFRGSDWTVVNAGDVVIAGGARAIVLRSEGLTLHVSVDTD